jgi:hypothetical protein
MAEDRIEILVEQAHSLFDKTSVFEVFDLTDRNEIAGILADFYGPVEDEKVDRYFKILDQLRGSLDP